MSYTIDFAKREDIPKIFELDREIFGEDGSIETNSLVKWFDANNYQWLVAKDEGDTLLGYIGFCHLKKDIFEKIVSGEISEKELSEDSFMEFKEGNEVYCYLSGFAVKRKYSHIAIALMSKSLAYFRFLKDKNMKVKKMCAVAVSVQGRKLCEKLGFKRMSELSKLVNQNIQEIFSYDFNEENYSKLMKNIKEIFLDSEKYL